MEGVPLTDLSPPENECQRKTILENGENPIENKISPQEKAAFN